MAERIANLGYFNVGKETTPGVPVATTDTIPLYEESMNTEGNFVKQQPVAGNQYNTYNVMQGQRSHRGEVTLYAEPNTAARIFDMLYTRLSTTGSGPYVHTYGLSTSVAPKSYTIDISTGNVVNRYYGVQASKISPDWNDNELRLKVALSALGSFQAREIASVSGSGPYSVVLKTDYDPNPTTGLIVGDLIRFKLAAGTTVDATVASITNGTTFTTSVNPTVAAGDSIYLRPATPTLNLLPSFMWAKNQWFFGATAAAALASSTQLRVEKSSEWEVMNMFESDDGADRSGAFDPAALVRTLADSNLSLKKFFDTPDDIIAFNNLAKSAAVIRHYSGPTNQYELRVTYNHLKTDGKVSPDMKAGDIQYAEIEFDTQWDNTDQAAIGIVIINGLVTV